MREREKGKLIRRERDKGKLIRREIEMRGR